MVQRVDISKGKKVQSVINISAGRDAPTPTRSNGYKGTISMPIYNEHTCVYWLHKPQ